jgi:hypothetical protein
VSAVSVADRAHTLAPPPAGRIDSTSALAAADPGELEPAEAELAGLSWRSNLDDLELLHQQDES